MITYTSSDLFHSPAQVLVNTVNTKGVMGKGIALKFKTIYPEMFRTYRDLCTKGDLTIGKLHLYKTPNKWILNFPTKSDWRKPSNVEYIEAGLARLHAKYTSMRLSSIAFPELGCGNGGLDFERQVKPIMERYLSKLSIPTFIHLSDLGAETRNQDNINETSTWLTSELATLPFHQMWADLLDILSNCSSFRTLSSGTEYLAIAQEDPPLIKVRINTKSIEILDDELLAFWQQLRDFGLTYNSISPRPSVASYLLPILAALPYVKRVKLSRTTSEMRTNPIHGVQIMPPVLSNQPEDELLQIP